MTISITNSSKFVAVAVGVGLVLAVAFGGFAAPAHAALSASQISSILSLLQSFGADATTIANVQASLNGQPTSGSGGSSSGCSITRDLTIGATGADVTCLQQALISMGFSIPAGATGYFGVQTQAAVGAWQSAHGVAPAAGYFGTISRAAWGATAPAPGPGTPPPGLSGGEGQIDNIDNLGDVESSVDEGDSGVKVLGAEFDAKDSDVSVQRVDVEFDNHSGNGSTRLDNYIDSVSLWLDGKKLASMDAGDVDRDDNGLYSFRFTNLNGVVKEDATANLYVSVDAVNNLDSTDDADTWDVSIPQDGIRAVDASGLSETYVSSSESTTLTETVTFNTASGGELQISEGDNNPDAGLVVVDDNNETTDVTLLEIDVKAKNSDITIHDFPVGITSSGATASSLIVKRVRLMNGSTVLKSKTLSSSGTYQQVNFDNIDFNINEDDTETFKVVADIFDTDSGEPDNGDSVTASSTGALSSWDAEDAKGDSLTVATDITGSVGGNAQSFYGSEGIAVTYKSSTAIKTVGSIAGAADVADFTIKFSVKNLGDNTIYFDGDTAAAVAAAAGTATWATTSDSTTGTTTTGFTAYGTGIVSADSSDSDDVLNSGDKRFVLTSGETRDFTFAVTIPAGGDNVNAGVKLTGFSWDTVSQDATANLYTFNLGDFKTNTLTGLIIQ